jgi:hypothetical protein
VKILGILFVFFGYVFVYASVAAGGRFATEPWAALFADAYTDAAGSTLGGNVIDQAGQEIGGAITNVGNRVGRLR